MGDFDGRVAIVTGAASGIGRAAAQRLAGRGARVTCLDVAAPGVEKTAASIREAGGQAMGLATDVTDEVAVKAAVAATVDTYGGVGVLANVAGIGNFRHTTEVPLDDWNRILAVNLTGVFLMCRETLPHLLAHGGAIVNVASIAAVKGHAYAAAYSASKGGVLALTRSLAIEYAKRGVRVNAVCPGGVVTPLLKSFAIPEDADPALFTRIVQPTEQLAQPDDIAAGIAFLASDDAGQITGTALLIDGGVSA